MARAPFAGAVVLAWIAVLVGSSVNWLAYGVGSGMLVLCSLLGCLRPVRDWNSRLGQAPASMAFLGAVAVLRDSGGGAGSGVAVLALIPVFYTALYGKGRRPLNIVLAGVVLFYFGPILIVRPSDYPHVQYQAAVLTVAVSSLIGLATQRLVAAMRTQAAESGRREQMLEQVGGVVRDLFASAEPRTDICRATLEISGARVAILFEPEPTSDQLRCTAMAGVDVAVTPFAVGPENAVAAAMRAGRARLLTHPITEAVAGPAVWEACQGASSILYQPLMDGDSAVGVLVVGWDSEVSVTGGRETVVALLAHEAALVIHRADERTLLTGMAETDPLTGLPNRRAWEARLNQAILEDEPVMVAMLDIDHFKRFNDTYGHPAGDRLLRETAAVWRDLLRSDDLLARLGGEEFGLLLSNCSPAGAADVTERLRQAVTSGQTASAGLAVRRSGEPLESVMGRADHALYDAKAFGRDHSRTAG